MTDVETSQSSWALVAALAQPATPERPFASSRAGAGGPRRRARGLGDGRWEVQRWGLDGFCARGARRPGRWGAGWCAIRNAVCGTPRSWRRLTRRVAESEPTSCRSARARLRRREPARRRQAVLMLAWWPRDPRAPRRFFAARRERIHSEARETTAWGSRGRAATPTAGAQEFRRAAAAARDERRSRSHLRGGPRLQPRASGAWCRCTGARLRDSHSSSRTAEGSRKKRLRRDPGAAGARRSTACSAPAPGTCPDTRGRCSLVSGPAGRAPGPPRRSRHLDYRARRWPCSPGAQLFPVPRPDVCGRGPSLRQGLRARWTRSAARRHPRAVGRRPARCGACCAPKCRGSGTSRHARAKTAAGASSPERDAARSWSSRSSSSGRPRRRLAHAPVDGACGFTELQRATANGVDGAAQRGCRLRPARRSVRRERPAAERELARGLCRLGWRAHDARQHGLDRRVVVVEGSVRARARGARIADRRGVGRLHPGVARVLPGPLQHGALLHERAPCRGSARPRARKSGFRSPASNAFDTRYSSDLW